jgi:exopolysaccharide biosynthesis polyprenyl glycosylphosphotransferase
MITKREADLSQIMVVVQVTISLILFLLIERFFPKRIFNLNEQIALLVQIGLIWGILFTKFRLGVIFRVNSFYSMIRGYLVTISFGTILIFSELELLPFMRHIDYSKKYLLLFACLNLVVLILFKIIFYFFMKFLRRKGYNTRHVVILADSSALPFVSSFVHSKDWGYHVAAIISPDTTMKGKLPQTHIIKKYETIKKFITQYPIDDIFYCLSIDDAHYNLEQLIKESEEIGVSLHIMHPDYLYRIKNKLKLSNRLDYTFETHSPVSQNYTGLKIKEGVDLFFSIGAFVLFAPLIALIAIFIKLEDGGPILFKQERIGLNGRRFTCYKFRSMVIDAEQLRHKLEDMNESDGPTFKIENDPRITKIGRIIRKTSMDELPQFYNVIKGEMSVVGPRPPLLKEVVQYERSQLRRLSMKPGITCKWQVWGRNQVTFAEWMKMDLDYIDNWSLILDFKIIVATVGVVFKANGQ